MDQMNHSRWIYHMIAFVSSVDHWFYHKGMLYGRAQQFKFLVSGVSVYMYMSPH
jgi:hypothetical protein